MTPMGTVGLSIVIFVVYKVLRYLVDKWLGH